MKKIVGTLLILLSVVAIAGCSKKQDMVAYDNFKKEFLEFQGDLSEKEIDESKVRILDYRDCDLIEIKESGKNFHYIWDRINKEFHFDTAGYAFDEAEKNDGVLIYEQNMK